MKKNMIFSGAMSMMTALLLCTACSSDDYATDKAAVAVPEGKVIHYTATVGEGDETRATPNSSKKYEFQTDDKLVITGTNISGDLTLATGAGTASATFSGDLNYTGGDTPDDDLVLKAVLVSSASESAGMTLTYDAAEYPTGAIASTLADAVQKYSHFTATSTYSSKSFSLSQQTAFLNFTVTFTDNTAANTDFDIVIKNGDSTVRTGSVKTAEVDSKVVAQFVAAMPKGTTMSSATVQLGTKSAIAFGGTTTLVANKIYNIKKTVAPAVPEGAISGQFSVASGKKVYFSKGNLQAKIASYASNKATASEWKFADSQDSYIGNAAGNTTFATGTWVDLFSWVGNSATYDTYGLITFTSSSKDNHGNVSGESLKTDWGTAAASSIGTGWRTLTGGSDGEWEYLFNGRTVNGGTGKGKSYTVGQKVNNVLGVVLYPDDYTGEVYSGSNWATFEAKGCVFLPAAGYRYEGTSLNLVGSNCYYWSGTANTTNSAYRLSFYSNGGDPQNSTNRYYGCSVRLVRDVQ